MSKGGGSPPSHTTSNVTQTTLPPYAEPYFKDLLVRTGYESAVPYTPYPGQRLAYFGPQEQEAMNRMTSLGVSGTLPELEASTAIAAQVGAESPYVPNMLRSTQMAQGMPSSAAPGLMGRYMNPYQQYVTDIAKREARRSSDIQGAKLGLDAARSGSLGGYREAIMQSERERNLGQQLSDLQMRGSERAFADARAAYEQDREAARKAAAMSQATYQQLLAGDRQRMDASKALAASAAQKQKMELERLKSLMATGQIDRELYQRGLDMGYADFLRQQAYPKEQLAFYSSMLKGLDIKPGEIQTSYGVGPSTTQQLLGSGIAGVGLYKALG